ncbi:MAG: DUF262 domain-containing protein [bacterium]|nr:DUF262 domain-containing protein [bacterium]
MSDIYLDEEKIIENDIEDNLDDSDELPFERYSITTYGIDFDISGLVNRIEKGIIKIPEFQREFVWKDYQVSQFIETLLLGLPVPSIFLSKNSDGTFFVIDGQQRLKSLYKFYKEGFRLTGVRTEFLGKTYDGNNPLDIDDRQILDSTFIRGTIMQQNSPDPKINNSSVYFVFNRLNTNASPLKPQEIRFAIFGGRFNDLLVELDNNPIWHKIIGSKEALLRKRGQELILRFFALYFDANHYGSAKSMDDFLTQFMTKHQHDDDKSIDAMRKLFLNTFNMITNVIPQDIKIFRIYDATKKRYSSGFNAAVFDSTMVGVAKRLNKGIIEDMADLYERYRGLMTNIDYVDAVRYATGNSQKVNRRIEIATKVFDEVK